MFDLSQEDYEVERAASILKDAREVERNQELMEKVAAYLKKEQECIEDALENMSEDLRDSTVEDEDEHELILGEEDSRITKFLARIRKDRKEEARKTNESSSDKRRRMDRNKGRYSKID